MTTQEIQSIRPGDVLAHESTVSTYATTKTVNSIESHRTGSRVERVLYTAIGKPRRTKRGFSVKLQNQYGTCCRAVLNEENDHWTLTQA